MFCKLTMLSVKLSVFKVGLLCRPDEEDVRWGVALGQAADLDKYRIQNNVLSYAHECTMHL